MKQPVAFTHGIRTPGERLDNQRPLRLSKEKLCCLLLIVLVPLLGACGTMGHRPIPPDRFDYNKAIATSWKEQMLLNMVRIRYREAPVFLDVASIREHYRFVNKIKSVMG